MDDKMTVPKPNWFISFLENKKVKVAKWILATLLFLGLLACSIVYVVFLQDNNSISNEFKKIWGGVVSFLAVLNVPLALTKISMLLHNIIMAKRKRELLAAQWNEFKNKRGSNGELMFTEKEQKAFIKNLKPIDRIELWCANNGRAVEGLLHYQLIAIIEDETLIAKNRIEKIVQLLMGYHSYNVENLVKELKTMF